MATIGENDEKFWLGFDLSTQQLKSVVIDDRFEIVHQAKVHFDNDLPEFRTSGGVHRRSTTITSPVLMWIKALDLILDRLRIDGLDYGKVAGISGCGQQHGSVYWKRGAGHTLANELDPARFLHQQLANSFSVMDSPVWMDASTTTQCRELEQHIGGAERLAEITGSRAYERFTGCQIARIRQQQPECYQKTERISLVSSFLATLFLGRYAPIDHSDASGMNLLDIRKRQWSTECLSYIDQDWAVVEEKLGSQVVAPGQHLGCLASYFVQRYGFPVDCLVGAFTGDNPASMVGMSAVAGDPMVPVVSLGTSDTIMFTVREPRPALHGHLLCHPIEPEQYMGMVVFKNGSLTRERIRDRYADGQWSRFERLLDEAPRGNLGNIGFYYDLEEIYPVIRGDYRFNRYDNPVSAFSAPEYEVRACVEGQCLRLAVHAERLGGMNKRTVPVSVTGGASANRAICAVVSDVFHAPVQVPLGDSTAIVDSAAYGAALLAIYGAKRHRTPDLTFDQMLKDSGKKIADRLQMVAEPYADAESIYQPMSTRYQCLEDQLAERSKE